MKLSIGFKYILFSTLFFLYGSGVFTWILEEWFQIDRGFGMVQRPEAVSSLQIHSILSLWFLILFGYLFHAHILVGWKLKKRLKSGLLLLMPLVLVLVSVPGLFYLSNDKWKKITSQFHIYVGLFLIVPFFIHFAKKTNKRRLTK